ncbi:hypothetical protein QVD17_11172 [Tagetes erecta]|uniref:Uncharacterized protein n=1 Tax=Tagetes erecta TaxID=13708 RepID=A0AAD8P6V6_TARER|nr:hypothetical protein QVD17_11172 [Tagetes erecta]
MMLVDGEHNSSGGWQEEATAISTTAGRHLPLYLTSFEHHHSLLRVRPYPSNTTTDIVLRFGLPAAKAVFDYGAGRRQSMAVVGSDCSCSVGIREDIRSDPVRKTSDGGFLMLEDEWMAHFAYDFETGGLVLMRTVDW